MTENERASFAKIRTLSGDIFFRSLEEAYKKSDNLNVAHEVWARDANGCMVKVADKRRIVCT